DSTKAELISKVLYPSDEHDAGKLLRLTQQYFLVSAALQNILHDHLEKHGTADDLPDFAAIHINDTHPAMCVAELMRLLLDECDYSWEHAWDITVRTMSYTNHTVMPEALETWREDLFRLKLPRIYTIICEINRRSCERLWNEYTHDRDKISRMAIVGGGSVRMANLSVIGSHTVNGVSALHSEILKKTVFSDFYGFEPSKFTNVTNGIDHRRWLLYSNPELTALLDECIGEGYKKDTALLRDFSKFRDDPAVLDRLNEIKHDNKIRLAKYAKTEKGVILDPDTVFDVHIKRMHEYKRQLLNVLRIISIYNALLEDPSLDIVPQTFIFSAKAAPGYYHAKQIIKLISHLSEDIAKRPEFKNKLSVAFMENYCVSLAEKLIPAAEISEQISLSGKEASGTGNMKLMMNGAVTIGTLDGANVEMREQLGGRSFYLFGLTTAEVDALWAAGYSSASYYNKSEMLQGIIRTLNKGFNGVSFSDFSSYLLYAKGIPDPYMCLADFASYIDVHNKMVNDYKDQKNWAAMSLDNIAASGVFSSDRSVREYADNIWHIKPLQ
ncbi:MAG: glycogen/starch/alpha-glucan phosphorylase, partial [Clostridia bacterium]|nr:glycogen/starch/alpha-glucan phosphorylase [Clostridia bacterium]